MSDGSPSLTFNQRLRRDVEAARDWYRRRWAASRGFRLVNYALGVLLVIYVLVWATIARGLPSAETLLEYEPPLPTMIRGRDGEIVGSYARERRVQLRYVDFPERVINAYLAAEDKTFWSHGGIDYPGLAGAVVDYASKMGSGERAKGGSTITQQVAKNILIGDEYSVTRKAKEMILARRMEGVLTKQQILELYLNEIPLGRQAFGVQAAARAYFGKDVGELALHEAAFLAILPKAPERYGREKHAALAMERRNFVLDQMFENEWISAAERDAAKSQPLGYIERRSDFAAVDADYFLEEIRRELVAKYGEKAEDGRNSVYAGGLWIRSSLDPKLQEATRDALRAGLLRYWAGKGWGGPVATIDLDAGPWQSQLAVSGKTIRYMDWRVGVVTERSGQDAEIGFSNGETGRLTGLPDKLKAGDVITVEASGRGVYAVRTVPEVSGGMVVQDPQTGRVLAMQGGFDSRLAAFNRATQALRQPGSTIKPFVYATALDHGMTPATMVSDGTFCVYQGAALGQKCFRNFDMRGSGGTHTMRWGLEQSRNLMTIHIANDTGMDRVVRTIEKVGIGKYEPYLSFALGAGDTTVLKMVNAYSTLANAGRQFTPTLVDYVQDRRGKVIWRRDNRKCGSCNAASWDGSRMPRFKPAGRQVMDARSAYQTVHMLEGVVQRGTATVLRDLNIPLFGKTGTTSGPTNVWFVGGSPDIVAGVYIGYDQPRSLGGYAQGGRYAAPIFKQLVQNTPGYWGKTPFAAPAGVRMVRIDRQSGRRVFEGEQSEDPKSSIIWEAFKPDTEPRRSIRGSEIDGSREAEILAAIRRAVGRGEAAQREAAPVERAPPEDFVEEQGGIY